MDMAAPMIHTSVTSRLRAVRRLSLILLWTLPSMLIQMVCVVLPGRPKVAFAKAYWAVFARLLGLQVRVIGQLASGTSERPVIFVCNHSA